ncbi:MAG: cytochrome c [Anaerolineales bacterium]
MRLLLPTLSLFVILSVASCNHAPTSPVPDQLSRGKAIYEQGCATENCHGTEGEGLPSESGFRAWPLVGDDFQRRNPTAQVVFDVVRSGGESSLRVLTDQQVYDSIAYELSLNDVQLSEPLDAQNAPAQSSGAAAKAPEPGSLFPPPGNAELITPWPASSPQAALTLPLSAEKGDLRIRVTQMALAASIGGKVPPSGGSFVLMVLTFEVLADGPLEVGPEQLSLVTADGGTLAPLDIGLAYPVDRFHSQTIQPKHGTAALVIFTLSEGAEIDHLQCSLPAGGQLILELAR